MRLPQFAAILVTSYFASTALALAAENNSNNCDDASVNFDDGATSINSPLADDCKAVIYSQKFIGLEKSQTRSFTKGTCTMSFHLGSGNSMIINKPQMLKLFDLVDDECGKTFPDGKRRMETHGDIICGLAAVNFEVKHSV